MNRFYRPVIISTVLLIIFIAGIGLSIKTNPGLFISEVCPHNDEVIHDSAGFYYDYIKLTNGSDEVIDLKGYGLSDDNDDLRKFIFPDEQIGPGESIMVWADDRSVFGDEYSDEDALFAGFRVRNHEYLYLTDPNECVIDSVRLPAIKRNMAFLRNAVGDKGITGVPTEQKNPPPVISDSIKPPVLSAGSGFYDEPFELTIDGGKETVYYTVDGSSPYTSGIPYEVAIGISDRSDQPDIYADIVPTTTDEEQYIPEGPVSKSTVVRAVSQSSDGSFSEETVATYFIGEEIRDICEGVYTLSIVSDPEGLFSEDRGIYVTGDIWDANSDKFARIGGEGGDAPANFNMRGKGWRRNSRLTLFAPSGTCLYDENDLITIRGRSSRALTQKGLNLKPARVGKKVFDGLFSDPGDILMLRTGGGDLFRTNIRDSLNHRIAKDLKIGAQASLCCQVWLDGEYWGCYNLQEHLDESFVEAKYHVPAGNVSIIKKDGDPRAISGLTSDLTVYQDLEKYVEEHDLADDENYRQFCDMVDIDSLIDYYCAEIFFANDDAYFSNVGMWRARIPGSGPYEDGKWRYLLFDLDNTDAYFETAAADVDSFVEGSWIGYNPDVDPFFSNLSGNRMFRARFRNRFMGLLDTDFSYRSISRIIDEMEADYTGPMVLSVRRFHDAGFTEESYREEIGIVRDFFRNRGGYIRDYLMKHMGD